MTAPLALAAVLPPREGCGPSAFGAISLSLRDFTLHSDPASLTTTVYGARREPAFAGIEYRPLPLRYRRLIGTGRAYLYALLQAFRAHPPAMIEVHNRPLLAYQLATQQRAPVTLFLHNDPRSMLGFKTSAQQRGISARLAGIYAVSAYIAGRVDAAACPLHITPLGIDLPPAPDLAAKQNMALYVGRVIAEKGVAPWCDALAQALPALPSWRAECIGAARFTPGAALTAYETDCRARTRAVAAQIAWHGHGDHDTVLDAFSRASIVAIPSLWEEPFGRVAIEAMAHGAAVITTGRGGLGDSVGDAAIQVPSASPEDFASALTTLAQDSALRHTMQQRGLARARDFAIATRTQAFNAARHACMDAWGAQPC